MSYIFLQTLTSFFSLKRTVNPGESWHRKSYVYPEEESIGSFMSTQKEWFLCH